MLTLKRYNGSLVTPRDDAFVTPRDDALLYDFLINGSGIFEGLNVTHLGANQLLITAGRGMAKGRDFTADEETVLATLSDSGTRKGRLLIRIDLANEESPIQFATQMAAALPTPVQEDINRDGTVYRSKMRDEFLDIIISNTKITSKMVNDVNFITCFSKTLRAVDSLTQAGKVKYYGNLIRNCFLSSTKGKVDTFELCFQSLQNLTDLDIVMLENLRKNYVHWDTSAEPEGNTIAQYANETLERICEDCGQEKEWVIATLDKLNGYGMCSKTIYQPFAFQIMKSETDYKVSPLYELLRQNILGQTDEIKV